MPANIIVVNGSIEFVVTDSVMPKVMDLLKSISVETREISQEEIE